MFKSLYQWTLSLAEKPACALGAGRGGFRRKFVFSDSARSFACRHDDREAEAGMGLCLICTLASVAGGILGYAIGALLFETVGKWLINLYGYGARVEELRAVYAHWGWAFILFKGLTPIPYKIVTITSGLLAYSLPLFILLSFVTRGARFFIVAVVLNRFGDNIRGLLEKYFALLMIVFIVIVIAGFFLAAHFI